MMKWWKWLIALNSLSCTGGTKSTQFLSLIVDLSKPQRDSSLYGNNDRDRNNERYKSDEYTALISQNMQIYTKLVSK